MDYLTFFFVRFIQYMILLLPLSLPVAFLLVCCALLHVLIRVVRFGYYYFLILFRAFCLSKYNTAPPLHITRYPFCM
jgi:hypothetical protein